MKPKARFIKSIIKSARENEVEMPWTRGNRRASFIATRSGSTLLRVKTA